MSDPALDPTVSSQDGGEAGEPASSRPSGVELTGELPTRLLYVEDDDDLRELMAITFVDAGFDVTSVSSAEAGLQLLETRHFDIVVTDYNLTGQTGAWLLQTATASGLLRGTGAIVLTSERAPIGVEGFRVLRKGADFGILLETISQLAGQLLPAKVVRIGGAHPTELDLVLYVTSTSQDSAKAIRNMHRALKPYDRNRYRLTIVDVAHGGDDAWYEGLEQDRVIVTPTLVKRKPAPRTWILGTLAPPDALERMLASVLGGDDDDG